MLKPWIVFFSPCSLLMLVLTGSLASAETGAAGEPSVDCARSSKVTDSAGATICRAVLSDLHPTQVDMGLEEVREKISKYSEYTDDELDEAVEKERVPVVRGPDRGLYLLDRHHTLRAFLALRVKYVKVRITADDSEFLPDEPLETRMREFWTKMCAQGRCWAEKENGDRIDPASSAFPRRLNDVGNNRLRSAVHALQDEGVLAKKASVYFYEFHLAKFLREGGVTSGRRSLAAIVASAADYLETREGREDLRDLHRKLGVR